MVVLLQKQHCNKTRLDKFIRDWTSLDELGQVGTSWDKIRQVGTSWDELGQVGTSWNKLGQGCSLANNSTVIKKIWTSLGKF